MSKFNRPDLSYKPEKVINDNIQETDIRFNDPVQTTSEDVVTRLLDHLSVIDEYKKRLESIDYLIKNAEVLAKSPEYKAETQDTLNAIQAFGGSGNIVDFNMFKQSIDIILDNYNNMSIVSLTGTKP